MATLKTDSKPKAEAEGDIWVSSYGTSYEVADVDTDTIEQITENVFVADIIPTLSNLIFTNKENLKILVTDPEGNEDEDLQETFKHIFKTLQIWSKSVAGFGEVFKYGCAVYSPGWADKDGLYTLVELRHLPSYTFRTASYSGSSKTYSDLLPGITISDDKEIQFNQINEDSVVVQIDNAFLIKNPSSINLTGMSTLKPLVPIVKMLEFVWDKEMIQVNRVGSKILFIKINAPARDGDKEYAEDIIKNWDSNTGYVLRDNMEVLDPHIKDDSTNLEVSKALVDIVIGYVTPTSLISSNEGVLIGSSDTSRFNLLNQWVSGIHAYFEEQWEQLFRDWLEYNQFEDYTVDIIFPKPVVDTSEIDIERAKVGMETGVLKFNEVRKFLGQSPVSEDEIKEITEMWDALKPAPSMFSADFENADTIPLSKDERKVSGKLMDEADQLFDNIIEALKNEE